MQTIQTYLLILICAIVLGACGHKGPLYLPSEKPATKSAVEQDAAAGPEETEKDDEAKKDDKKGQKSV